jgi:hypothetical protein
MYDYTNMTNTKYTGKYYQLDFIEEKLKLYPETILRVLTYLKKKMNTKKEKVEKLIIPFNK